MKTEPSDKGNLHLAARRARKAALLPRAAALAAEGRTYQEIADALGIAKSTVCQWLRDRPLGRAAAKALGTPRMTAKLAARYESLCQRALREWNRSNADRQTKTVVTIEPPEGGPTTTTTVRTEPQKRNAACLGKALAAMKAMEGLHWRELSRQDWLENLQRNAAADKNEDGLTRTVKTTMTRSGRKLRTVVTRRSDAGRLAAHRDELKDADEMRRALEARLDAGGENIRAAIRAEKELQAIEARMDVAEEAADEEARAALKAEAAAAEEKLQAAEARLGANEHAAPACPPAIAANEKAGEKGAEAAGAPNRYPSPEKKTEMPIPGRRGWRTALRRKGRSIGASLLCKMTCGCGRTTLPAFRVRQRCRTKSSKRVGLRRNKTGRNATAARPGGARRGNPGRGAGRRRP